MSSDFLLKPAWPQLSNGVGAQYGAFTTVRAGGVSHAPYDDHFGAGGFNLADHVGDTIDNVVRNRTRLAEYLSEFSSPDLQWLSQVHGTTVLNLDEKQGSLVADACISTRANVVCAVLTADCLPVLFCDRKHGVVGAAHAGWRGLAAGVLENTVFKMKQAGAYPEHILAWLGPAIGPSKFEVGKEVREQFVGADTSTALAFTLNKIRPGKFYADIYKLARIRLQRAGVEQISGGQFCTFSQPDKFYSYRRDGVTGRMASLIWIKSQQ
ncbi:MAG: hypothetical protein K0R08_1753 [Solimicrobium sp.]|jgi:YfiH family protein|nr:hypothetical protein [Solimicrobium sp.]